MRRIILPVLVVFLISPFLKDSTPVHSNSLAFTHVTVIDATGAPASADMTVVITDSRISDIGKTAEIPVPQGAQVVDGRGKFLIPGLWDMHVHWHEYKDYLRLFTANGVTGVRVMWGAPINFKWRREIEAGSLIGPHLVISSTIMDGPKPVWPGSVAISNEAEARKAVRTARKDGFDFIKVYSLLPRPAYFAIADEAKKQGLEFAGHVPIAVSPIEASDAGQKSIEHLTGILGGCSTREEELRRGFEDAYTKLPVGQRLPDPARLRPLTRMMLETFNQEKATTLFQRLSRNHTWQCPTLTVLRSSAFLDDPGFRNDPRLKYVPKEMRTAWNPANDFRFRARATEDFDLSRQLYKKQIELVGLMHRAGVEFIAGTDVSNPYCFPGFSLHDELSLMVEAGLSPMEALQTATYNAARFLGKQSEFGSVEKGKIADLVLLDADPLTDIRNTSRINSVIQNGRLLNRAELDRLLAEVEKAAKK